MPIQLKVIICDIVKTYNKGIIWIQVHPTKYMNYYSNLQYIWYNCIYRIVNHGRDKEAADGSSRVHYVCREKRIILLVWGNGYFIYLSGISHVFYKLLAFDSRRLSES